MEDVWRDVDTWQRAGETAVALATVIQTWGSAPRKVGAKMAITSGGAMSGSVSGGCVEGAVVAAAADVLETGQPQLLHFGVADETAWDVGLACGGTIEIFVQPLNVAVFDFLQQLVHNNQAGACLTVIRGPAGLVGRQLAYGRNGARVGQLGAGLDDAALAAAESASRSQRVALSDAVEIFVDRFQPAPTLIIVGGVHIAISLTNMAKTLGYRTLVVDPRRAFSSAERFPHGDRLIQAWPDKAFAQVDLTPETAVAVLTHDPKIDDPALTLALNTPVFYVGALGSRKTHARRLERLRAAGCTEAALARIHAPIGLDIGAATPQEIALAVLAEIVRARRLSA